MKNKNQFVLVLGSLFFVSCVCIFSHYRRSIESVDYISNDLMISDAELIDRYKDPAESGELAANLQIYERLYFARENFEAAKPYLERAAAAGDDSAREILRDPEGFLEKFKADKK